ncbi:helix-turn-helix domain-containing protein [Halomonas cerina]|uniref:Helix-turn-helix domain-containing protein n=1 Tax=Halomonas cerina TaxID=447424 RepID=A0A839VBL0_9GAMM|nr:helix-turn-helix domain-containing protein [Halomonas cerina]MBB3191395.1 hypothetical protein [Halomonas cerina]
MTIERFAELSGLEQGVVYGHIRNGHLPAVKVGKYRMFNIALLQRQCLHQGDWAKSDRETGYISCDPRTDTMTVLFRQGCQCGLCARSPFPRGHPTAHGIAPALATPPRYRQNTGRCWSVRQ